MPIRTATLQDCTNIAQLEAQCFPPSEAASEQTLFSRLSVYPNHFWLLEERGVLISFINGMVTNTPELCDTMYEEAALHNEQGDWQMIFGVTTHPEYRRKGYASRLMHQVLHDAATQNRRGVVLTCKKRLVPYYAAFGFCDEGLSLSTHGGVPWHAMRLTFNPSCTPCNN